MKIIKLHNSTCTRHILILIYFFRCMFFPTTIYTSIISIL